MFFLSCSLRTLLLPALLLCFALPGCSHDTSDLPANERPIPAKLAVEDRASQRLLPFAEANNFRELGGYRNNEGKTVKWGLLYRSDKLSALNAEDELFLDELALKRIVDFRSIEEREREPDRIGPASSIAVKSMPMAVRGAEASYIIELIEKGELDSKQLRQILIDANREMVINYSLVYRSWLESLLEPGALPMAFHCTAGKDRTGLAAALLLLALDIPMETVMQDYLASNYYNATYNDNAVRMVSWSSLFQVDGEALRPVLIVDAAYIQAAFDTIDEHYGSLDNYFVEGLGLTLSKRQALKDLLLE